MNSRRYTQFCLSTFVGSLLVIAGFNGLVDAQGVFRFINREGFNREKPLLEKEGVRKIKSIDIAQGEFTTLLLGTSRTFGGLNPEHSAFTPKAAYNAALPGTNFYETHKVFDYAVQHLPLQRVILELDFTAFSDEQTVQADFKDSRFAGENVFLSSLDSLLSLYQLRDSWETLQFNRAGRQARYTAQGFRRHRIYDESTDPESNDGPLMIDLASPDLTPADSVVNHHELFVWANKQYMTVHAGLAYDSRDRRQRLQDTLEKSAEYDLELHLFIPPLHAHLLESLAIAGLMPKFEQWKRDLVQIVDAHNRAHPDQPPLKLWDFSTLNSVTTEPVPADGSTEQMQWYVESSHFRPELGDYMLDLMLGSSPSSEQRLSGADVSKNDISSGSHDSQTDFGVVLTPENIEEQLLRLRTDLVQYRKNNPEDIRMLNALYKEVSVELIALLMDTLPN